MSANPKTQLDPAAVHERLQGLRALYVPMTEEEARNRLAMPASSVPFADAVAARLGELRALMRLTAVLSRASAPSPNQVTRSRD